MKCVISIFVADVGKDREATGWCSSEEPIKLKDLRIQLQRCDDPRSGK